MPYASLENLIDRYGRSMLVLATDRGEDPTGEIDVDVVARALADTDGMINGYLGRYTLPLFPVPEPLPDLAQAIAIYKLHRYQPDPKIIEDYKDALRALREISTGVIRLAVADTGVEPEAAKVTGIRVSDRVRPLTVQNLKGFI